MKNAVEMILTGNLYKTGFRFYAQQKGIELGITGTIGYYGEYGDVLIFAEGEAEALKAYTDWCAKGMPYCKVDEVHIKIVPPLDYRSFDIITSSPEFVETENAEVLPKMKSLRLRIFGF